MTAAIDPASGVVRGTAAIDLQIAEGEDEAILWLYADRVAVSPAEMDEISTRWIFPGEVDHGRAVIQDVRVEGNAIEPAVRTAPSGSDRGRDVAGSDLVVPIPPGPRRAARVTFRFDLRLPARFGRLGAVDGALVMTGPWYPLVVGSDDAIRHRVPHRVRVVAPPGTQMVVGDVLGRSTAIVDENVAFIPIVAAPRLHVRTRRVAPGVLLRYIGLREPYDPPRASAEGLERLDDVVRIDTVGLVARTAERVVETMEQLDLPIRDPRIDVVEVPSRTELAATAPELVLVSDRLYEVFPLDQVRAFHERALRRALFRHLIEPTSDEAEAPADRGWADDLRAVLLTELDEARRDRRVQRPDELVGWAAFHPAVDQLLYAPQVAFVDVYFGAIAEPDPFRDDPVRARRPLSRGRRILESARDALVTRRADGSIDDARFRRFALLLLERGRSARSALAEVAPELDRRWRYWLDAPGLEVNYRLGAIRSDRTPSGRWRHTIEVIRDGPYRADEVDVEVVDEVGAVATARWNGEEARGRVVLETAAPLDDVTIDPRMRLPQSAEVAEGHPRRDDAISHPWKPPLLRAFILNVALPELEVSGLIDVAMRRRYDLESTLAARVETGPAATGGSIRYIRSLGPKIDLNRRLGFVSGNVAFDRLHEGFVEDGEGGYRLSIGSAAGIETRRFAVDPRSGQSLTVGGHVGGVRRDDGSFDVTGGAGIRGSLTFGIGARQAFSVFAGGGWSFGPSLPSDLQALAGRFVLRGYESDELVGEGAAYGVIEHRWTPVSDMAWNVLHLAWIRELQLAAFAGGGAIFQAIDGQDVLPAAEVGGGLRLIFEYGGVQPGVFSLDVAVPLVREDDRVFRDGELIRRRAPIGIYASFDQFL